MTAQLPVITTTPSHQLPPGWNWKSLSHALHHRKEFITIDDSTTYKRVRVQLHGRGIVLRDEVKGAAIRTKKQQTLKPLDFLVAEIDAKMGGFGVVSDTLAGGLVSSHYFTFEVDRNLLLHEFLEAFIKTGFITHRILQHVRGSLNYAAIRPRHILGIQFPFAAISIQEAIAADFRAVETARLALGEQLRAVEALPKSILRNFLGQNWSAND